MSEEAKGRLRKIGNAHALRMQGRKSLRGLNVEGFCASLDAMLAGDVPYPKSLTPREDNAVMIWLRSDDAMPGNHRINPSALAGHGFRCVHSPSRPELPRLIGYNPVNNEVMPINPDDERNVWTANRYREELATWLEDNKRVCWVQIADSPKWMHEHLQRAFEYKTIFIQTLRRAPKRSRLVTGTHFVKPVEQPIYPAGKIVHLFAAIWPQDWRKFVKKYLVGFTANQARYEMNRFALSL